VNTRLIIESVLQNRVVQIAVKALQVPRIANGLLRLARIERRIDGTDLRYRVRYCDTFLLARGIFGGEEYGLLKEDARQIRTFVDLGCNVGLFPLYLCFLRGDRAIRGFLVDANPDVVREASENLKLNGLAEAAALHGLASGRRTGEDVFVVAQNTLSSTTEAGLLGSTLGTRTIQVPAIDVQTECDARFGPEGRTDLLKLDIEGSELEFLTAHADFLARCDRVIMEFHKPKVTLDSATALMTASGFALAASRDRDSDPWGIAYYRRPGV